MPSLNLYINDELVYEKSLSFEGIKVRDQHRFVMDQYKILYSKYKKCISGCKWDIILEISSKMNNKFFK